MTDRGLCSALNNTPDKDYYVEYISDSSIARDATEYADLKHKCIMYSCPRRKLDPQIVGALNFSDIASLPGYEQNANKKDMNESLSWFMGHVKRVINLYNNDNGDTVSRMILVAKQKLDQEMKYDLENFNEYRILSPEKETVLKDKTMHRILLGVC